MLRGRKIEEKGMCPYLQNAVDIMAVFAMLLSGDTF